MKNKQNAIKTQNDYSENKRNLRNMIVEIKNLTDGLECELEESLRKQSKKTDKKQERKGEKIRETVLEV